MLLIAEVRRSNDAKRVGRLLNRAIQALKMAHGSDPSDPHLALTLAEAHGERFRHSNQPADVLAANLLLDRLNDPIELNDRIATLRSLISHQPTGILKQGGI